MKSSLFAKIGTALLACPLLVSTQQFDFRKFPFDALDLSDSCFKMLDTTVPECSYVLLDRLPGPENYHFPPDRKTAIPEHHVYRHNDYKNNIHPATRPCGPCGPCLDDEHLDHICIPACRDALVNFRTKAEAACNTTKDAIAFKYNNIIFPPTYQVDLLLLSYDVFCYKDRDTGKSCDLELTKWRRRRDTDFPMECEDCSLGRWRKQLEAPIRYSDEEASRFSKSISACAATGYEYAKPTAQYATTLTIDMKTSLRNLTTTEPTPEPTPEQ
ncbi:hypothetical protein CEP54_013685 [Fusarium duplospermum]|uniref:Uncharacterized protein n=1 Tax=Fusarium duplospermum TaxID=1325734 RepID=A0A428P1B6_9HYPO|nr:hypothetical protein CEP54_013685 [Fusarium duplospermum]